MFEHVYFARPDSYVFGKSVNEVRTNLGRMLAREAPVDADVVVPIPDSGVCAAVGFAEESGIPMRMGLIRNHYVGRTFIQPQQSIRHFGVRVKLNPVRSILEGKRVVLVDDSIVRGTTSRKIVRMVQGGRRQAKCTCASVARRRSRPASTAWTRRAARSSSPPPTRSMRSGGISTPTTLSYLSLEGLLESVGHGRRRRTAHRATPANTPWRSRATRRHTCSSR